MSKSNKLPPDLLGGPISWMARNTVAANLLMGLCFAAGFAGLATIKQEVFPEFALDVVNVSVPYPGASPAEVEQGIVLAVEEAVRGLEGVKRITSTAKEGSGTVSVELLIGEDPDAVVADVKNAVDRITTFPEDAEKPTVAVASRKREVVSIVLAGEQELATLHGLAERARAELLEHEDVTQVEIFGIRPLEVAIEIPRETLEAYGLTLDQVAQQIRSTSVELPGGGIDTDAGEILVRVADRKRKSDEFSEIILRSNADGSRIRLSDIATITDGYAETDQASFFDGHPAVRVTAYRVGDETPMEVAAAARTLAAKLRDELPASVIVEIWADDSESLTARLDLLFSNARAGLVLVLVILGLFLKRQLAGWVALGIPISFLGALGLLPFWDVSINMVTSFAFIVTLGLVVDDAIVVGENIYTKLEDGQDPLQASIEGAKEMAVPVTFSVLTTVVAFMPLLFVPGTFGKIFKLIPAVVISVLLFSLVESFFVLPAHLGHGPKDRKPSKIPFLDELRQIKEQVVAAMWAPVDAVRARTSAGLVTFTNRVYRPVLRAVLSYRYITVATGIAVFIMTIASLRAGIIPFSFFPKLEGDRVSASVRLPYGAPVERTAEIQRVLERSARAAIEELGGNKVIRGMFGRLGQGPRGGGPRGGSASGGSHLATVEINLVPTEERPFSSAEFGDLWKKKTPPIAGAEAVLFQSASGPGAGAAVNAQLSHSDTKVLAAASAELAAALREYPDLTNIQNEYAAGKPQFDYHLSAAARSFDLTARDVARQIRSAFFGAEALREQRGRNELKVMVRLPKEQRRSEFDLESLEIAAPGGGRVPLATIATFDRKRAPTEINREQGKRIVNVSGELAAGVVSPQKVLDALDAEVFPRLLGKHRGLSLELVGEQREQAEVFKSLGKNFGFAMFVVFALLAIPFKSYSQPLLVMLAIPFGFVGAVWGHAIMGYEMSLPSMFGIIALAGVVVNDSLVLIDSTNRARRGGRPAFEAIVFGGTRRMRPILLTSLTTAFGLGPMIFETSAQARFLIPMAISLGFGVIFATVIVLILVPAAYLILDDIHGLLGIRDQGPTPEPPPLPPRAPPAEPTVSVGA